MEAYHLTNQKQPLEVFYIKKGLFKIWIHRKTPMPSPFFNKDAGLIKKETVTQVFSCEFWQIFKHIFFPPKLLRAAVQFFYFISPLKTSKCPSIKRECKGNIGVKCGRVIFCAFSVGSIMRLIDPFRLKLWL